MNFKLPTSNIQKLHKCQIQKANPNRFVICLFLLAIFSYLEVGSLRLDVPSFAMGSAPKKEEPKYKLEILKMEVVPATGVKTLESVPKKGAKKNEPQYKLEILKMDFIPAVTPETKKPVQ